MRGITLIGMPGSGKSSIGKALAERLSFDFLDLDVHIAGKERKTVGEIAKEKGGEELCRLEEKCALEVPLENTVLAPGGSIVYSAAAMGRLKKETTVIFLDVPLEELERRIGNLHERGIVGLEEKSLAEIFDERATLYRKYADMTVGGVYSSIEDIARRVREVR